MLAMDWDDVAYYNGLHVLIKLYITDICEVMQAEAGERFAGEVHSLRRRASGFRL